MVTKKFHLKNAEEIMEILGAQDQRLKRLEKELRVRVFVHHHPETESATLTIKGTNSNADKAACALKMQLENFYDSRLLPAAARAEELPDEAPEPGAFYRTPYGESVAPRGENQKRYVEAIASGDITVGVGPAGTGKTYLAAAMALKALRAKTVRRIILTRPIVEAGEKLGFLPGDVSEKVHPYLKPLYDAFYTLLGPERFRALREDEVIETVPLAYMRGRTLENAFIILDEAQNTMPEQMKMFLTRMGVFSKVVVTGDTTQIDLRDKERSGLVQIQKILHRVPGIRFVNFTNRDVVRHPLVREIVAAYDEWEKENP